MTSEVSKLSFSSVS